MPPCPSSRSSRYRSASAAARREAASVMGGKLPAEPAGQEWERLSLHHAVPPRWPDLRLRALLHHLGPSLRIETGPPDQHPVELRPGEQQPDIAGVDASA